MSAKSPSQNTSISKAIPSSLRTGKTTYPRIYKPVADLTLYRDQSLTLSQNYCRLGLSSKLNGYAGGTEVKTRSTALESQRKDTLSIPTCHKSSELAISLVKVTRDPKTGAIVSVHQETDERENPSGDRLNKLGDLEDEDEDGGPSIGRGIIAELEEQAKYGRPKRPRMQSQREREWIERLVERWGDDWGGMFRDRKLNPLQQSEGDLKRRIGVWKGGKRKGQQEGEGWGTEVG